MRLSVDPKPLGAFIEYTLKPILDTLRELLEKIEIHGLKAERLLGYLLAIYIIDFFKQLIITCIVTGAVCYTAIRILSYYPNIAQ